MSFKGEIEARCPRGCEPFTTEVWSFIRGDQSPELRDAVLWRECNMVLCPSCDAAFFPETSYIYYEPPAEIMAFVFPESYRDKEEFWRAKMHEDFVTVKESLGSIIAITQEPEIFFGHEELAKLLEKEDFHGEEREVMEVIAQELGLSLYRVRPSFARSEGMPRTLPYAPARSGGKPTPENVVAGLRKLLAANDRLAAYQAYLESLEANLSGELPPPAARLS